MMYGTKLKAFIAGVVALAIGVLFFLWLGSPMNPELTLASPRDTAFVIEVPYQNLLPGEERYARQKITVPVDTYVTSFVPRIDGTFAVLHHVNIVDTSERDIYCADLPRGLFASGNEIKIVEEISPGYGIPVRAGAVVEALVHFANSGTHVESGTLHLQFKGEANRKPVIPILLTIADYCLDPSAAGEYVIPAGISESKTRMKRTLVLPHAGKLLMWGGHVHQYGLSLRLIRNGEVVSTLLPFENPHRMEAATSSVYLRRVDFTEPLAFQAGDVIDMEAVYQKPADLFYQGAMGVAGLFFDFNE